MTTVAVKDNVIAADTLATGDTTFKVTKLFVTTKGVIGVAGAFGEALKFVEWYKDRRKKKPTFDNDSEFTALVLKPNGAVEMWDGALHPIPINQPVAIGSGAQYALGAMRAGVSAEEAVGVACTLDPHSAAPIESEEV